VLLCQWGQGGGGSEQVTLGGCARSEKPNHAIDYPAAGTEFTGTRGRVCRLFVSVPCEKRSSNRVPFLFIHKFIQD
jgi:hypothetical protein